MHSQQECSLLSLITPAYAAFMRTDIDEDMPLYLRTEDLHDTLPSPLFILLNTISYMPFKLRKFLLDFSRNQNPVQTNKHLQKGLKELRDSSTNVFTIPPKIHRQLMANTGGQVQRLTYISVDDLIPILDTLHDNPIGLSLLSYFVRAERTLFPDEFRQVGEETIRKELQAGIHPNVDIQLDYRGIFTDDKIPIHKELEPFPERVAFLWKTQIRRITSIYAKDTFLLFPTYNGKKNISYSTQRNIETFLNYQYPSVDQPTDYTTLDLIRTYYESGMQIEGDLEIRVAWRFNDLKPRGYYCIGGTSFWASCYIKDFTKRMQETMQSTHPFSRFNVTRIQPITEDQIIITYDYSAFTTSLSELKHFMWYLGNAFRGTMVKVLDVHVGVIEIDLGQYIHDYNEIVNMHQMVSLCRLMRKGYSGTNTFQQCRSGSLGVPGNIGLSTSLHGLSICSASGTPDEDSIVGDDALLAILLASLSLFITIINKLGVIHAEKIATFQKPPFSNPSMSAQQGFKYLKRPITVDSYGTLITGFLDFFPNIGVCLCPQGDGIHSQRAETVQEILQTFCMQWGRYLTQYSLTPWTQDLTIKSDIAIILCSVQTVYSRYGLPFSGCLPFSGFYFASSFSDDTLTAEVNFWVPPCEDDSVFQMHWLDVLFSTHRGRDLIRPVSVGMEIPLPRLIYPGLSQVVTMGKLESLLVDLKLATKEIQTVRMYFDEGVLARVHAEFSGQLSERSIYKIVIDVVPQWYDEVYTTMYPVPFSSAPHGDEARTEISTLWEGLSDNDTQYDTESESDYGFAE